MVAVAAYLAIGMGVVLALGVFRGPQYNPTQDGIHWLPHRVQIFLWWHLLREWNTSEPEFGYISRSEAWQTQIIKTESSCPDAVVIREGRLPPLDVYLRDGGLAFDVIAEYR